MKVFACLWFLYIIAATALPSVRAVKHTFFKKCQSESHQNTSTNSDPLECDKGKFILNLNFTPVQCVKEQFVDTTAVLHLFETIKIEKSYYEKIFIDQYGNTIWHPPKSNPLV